MRLKRAMSLKSYRRRLRSPTELDVGARPARRSRRRRPAPTPTRPRAAARPDRRRERAERVHRRLWSEAVPLGENLRIQAAHGYRGAFLELRPGLYLVAELRDERGEFGRKVEARDVTSEIVRVTDQALDAIFPRRRAQKQADRDEARRRERLARREQELARQRQAERERAEREAAARAAQSRALPAPTQYALPAPRTSPLPRGAARWVDEDLEDDAEAAGWASRGERWR